MSFIGIHTNAILKRERAVDHHILINTRSYNWACTLLYNSCQRDLEINPLLIGLLTWPWLLIWLLIWLLTWAWLLIWLLTFDLTLDFGLTFDLTLDLGLTFDLTFDIFTVNFLLLLGWNWLRRFLSIIVEGWIQTNFPSTGDHNAIKKPEWKMEGNTTSFTSDTIDMTLMW